jgi:hypothetical protein
MSKSFLSLIILCWFQLNLFAQDPVKLFEIVVAKIKVQNSLYNKIEFVDSREDSSFIGIVNVGLLKNHDARLMLKLPVLPQLKNLLNSMTDSSAGAGELLFQLKDFRFAETRETRYCYLNAALYAKKENSYQKLCYLDTVIIVTVSDVTKVLINEGNKILSNYLASVLLQPPTDSFTLSIQDIKNIESIEKRQIPVYNTPTYTEGLYNSYISFKNQVPDKQGIIDMGRDGIVSSVKALDSNGKKTKVKSKNIYALVYKGRPFIATEYGFYPLERVNNNLFFTGDVKIFSSSADIRTAQVGFGLIGAALASAGYEAKYDMIIDHLNGRFIHLLSIKLDTDQ